MSLMVLVLACATAQGEMGGHPLVCGRSPDMVMVARNAIVMTMGRFALARNGSQYCAIRFTGAWKGEKEDDYYSDYESYYQDDGTGHFSNENVRVTKERLIHWHLVGFHPFSFPAGRENPDIKCGPIRLAWAMGCSIHFFATGQPQGDHGIELAPTKWTDISQVNVLDPRLKWYRYNGKRETVFIPIDQLWGD